VRSMAAAGIDYAQILDQNHGGNPYFCYSRDHGHAPVPGPWMTRAMCALLERAREAGQGMLFGCESAAGEPYIPQLMLSDNRFNLGWIYGKPVPMFAYVYHEYLSNFMGNQVCAAGTFEPDPESLAYRLAYALTAGLGGRDQPYTAVGIHATRCRRRLAEMEHSSNQNSQTGGDMALLKPALEHLELNIFSPDLIIGELHLLCGVSDTYFRKVFISCFGKSPKKYVQERRLAQAKAVIDNGEYNNIYEVAQQVGFEDPLYFGKVFKNKYGYPPSEKK